MLNKLSLTFMMLLILTGIPYSNLQAESPSPPEKPLPAQDQKIQFDKNSFGKVVGAGHQPFSYQAKGESLILMTWPEKQNMMVLVPDKNTQVKFDPANGKLDYTKEGKNKKKDMYYKGTWVVLEYLR